MKRTPGSIDAALATRRWSLRRTSDLGRAVTPDEREQHVRTHWPALKEDEVQYAVQNGEPVARRLEQ